MNKLKILFLHGFMGAPQEGLFLQELGSVWAPDLLKLSLNSKKNLQSFYKTINDYNPELIYGYSLGGRIALDYLSLYTEYKGKVVIESASIPLSDSETREKRSVVDQARSQEIREDFPQFLENWYSAPLWGERTASEIEKLKGDKPERFKSVESLEALANFLFFFSPAHFPLEPIPIKKALLYLYGEQDSKYKKLAESYGRSHPHWSFQEVSKAGHNIHSFKEMELLKYLREFLST